MIIIVHGNNDDDDSDIIGVIIMASLFLSFLIKELIQNYQSETDETDKLTENVDRGGYIQLAKPKTTNDRRICC